MRATRAAPPARVVFLPAMARASSLRPLAGCKVSGLGQRNELLLVAGDEGERAVGRAAPFAPVALRLLDALLGAGHEVPPDVPRLGEGIAREQDEAARHLGAQV